MSYRIVIAPSHFGEDPTDVAGADVVIPVGATDEDVDKVAAEWNWRLPLKIWTPSEQDSRYLRLLKTLEEEYNQEVLSSQAYVKGQ